MSRNRHTAICLCGAPQRENTKINTLNGRRLLTAPQLHHKAKGTGRSHFGKRSDVKRRRSEVINGSAIRKLELATPIARAKRPSVYKSTLAYGRHRAEWMLRNRTLAERAFPSRCRAGLLYTAGQGRNDLLIEISPLFCRTAGRNDQEEPPSRHFVRVYAILKPLRSALRCELLPTSVTIIAKSQSWSKA